MQMKESLLYFSLLSALVFTTIKCECADVTFSSRHASLGGLRRVQRISVSGLISAFVVEVSVSDDQFTTLKQQNGNSLVVYSTLSHNPQWTDVDAVASALQIRNAFGVDDHDFRPLILLTVCDYDSGITAMDDSPYIVDAVRTGLVSTYENELIVQWRSFRSGLFLYSLADQGDMLVAQVVRGTIHVIFDFGSLSPSRIIGGRALDDGRWHEMRWLHQFDSVQLSIDGVLLNETTPSGLYRKLDLHSQVHVGGRPSDDFSDGFENSFTGCIARLELNAVDLLQFAPRESYQSCQMMQPPLVTVHMNSSLPVPFTFLPFSFETRLLPVDAVLLDMVDADNSSLLQVKIEGDSLTLLSKSTKYKQTAQHGTSISNGGWHSFSLRIRGSRMEVDVDGLTMLWLEGHEVRRISARLAILRLSAPGCYRSTTVDLPSVNYEGVVTRDSCLYRDRCLPSPCENGGTCLQTTLDDYKCICRDKYYGKNCHTCELPRSCEEWQYHRGRRRTSRGRNVTIDLDGGGSLTPMNVICRNDHDELGMEVVSTILQHSLEKAVVVTGDTKVGSVRTPLDYGLSTEQLDRLVEGFESCSQYMKFVCRGGAKLMTFGEDRTPSSWYSTRSDKHGLQWGDAQPYSRMCSCAINGSCLHNRMCNCDSGLDAIDEGDNNYNQLLPVTGLFLGGTTKSSSVEVEIGPLICRQRVSFDAVTFSDRNAKLSGSRQFTAASFHFSFHIKATHSHLGVFAWESSDALHWFQLNIQEGKVVGEIVNGGETVTVSSPTVVNDGRWHSVYWEANRFGLRLSVDGKTSEEAKYVILPNSLHWIIGSRTERGSTGFAGVIRNVDLCGEELPLSNIARREGQKGVHIGEEGYCRMGLCRNGGRCEDRYDGFVCDCSMTPFGGPDCSREYGMWVPLGSSLQIPWQNPAHTASCYRIAIHSDRANFSLIRARSLFADSTFNLTLNGYGNLVISVYDGFFYRHKETDQGRNFSDHLPHDVAFCADSKNFNLTIDDTLVTRLEGNWTFFENLNVWHFLDTNFTGCVSRLQIGQSFPLKDPKLARLQYEGKIRFGTCPPNALEWREQTMGPSLPEDIRINAIRLRKQNLISVASICGLIALMLSALVLSVLVCYMKSRPEGVYKTHEGDQCSPSRSEEPLVHNQHNNHSNNNSKEKEYFC